MQVKRLITMCDSPARLGGCIWSQLQEKSSHPRLIGAPEWQRQESGGHTVKRRDGVHVSYIKEHEMHLLHIMPYDLTN